MAKKSTKNKNWIQGAIKRPGALTKKAQSANMTVPQFTSKVLSNKEKYSPLTVKQANLAKTLRKFQDGGANETLPNQMRTTSTITSPGMASFAQLQAQANELTAYNKQELERKKAEQKAAEEAKQASLMATGTQAAAQAPKAIKATVDAAKAAKAAKAAGDVGKVAGEAAKFTPQTVPGLGTAVNIGGELLMRASDDKDPTKYNAGETTGTLLKGAGSGLSAAGMLASMAPALAIPGIGWAAAGVGALTAGAIALHRRNKARKEKEKLDAEKASEQNNLNRAFTESWNQAYKKSGTDMGYNIGSSSTNSYLPGQQQMAMSGGMKKYQPGGQKVNNLLSGLEQMPDSKPTPIQPAQMAQLYQKVPSQSNLLNFAAARYASPELRSLNPQTIQTNPYVLQDYNNAAQFGAMPLTYSAPPKSGDVAMSTKQTGGKKVEGGIIKPLQSGAVEFVGRTHKQGGIIIDPKTEVENGETMDKVEMKSGGSDYIFSNYLKLGGKTFAQRHKEILNRKGSQKEIQDLAKMQEAVAAKDGETNRTPDSVMQNGGVKNPNPWMGSPEADWAQQAQQSGNIDAETIIGSRQTGNLGEEQFGNFYGNYPGYQENPEKFYDEVYTPRVREYFRENPDEAYQYLQQMVNSNDPNAENFKTKLLDKDGNMLPKEEALKVAEQLATDKKVGSFHMILPEQVMGRIEPSIPRPELVGKPGPKTPPDTPPGTIPPKDIPILPLGWSQLAGPISALRKKYPEAQMAYTSPVGRINLPRVNYNAERAANANQTNALQRSIENSSSGPAGMALRMGAMSTARQADLDIANAEAQVNKNLMAEEATQNLRADMANAQIGADMAQFNAQLRYQSDINKYDNRLRAVNQIGNILTNIGMGYRQDLADERVARAVQINGEYDRERMKSAAKLRNTKVNVDGKDVKFRNLSPAKQNEVAAMMYLGQNNPAQAQEFLKQDRDIRAAAYATQAEKKTEETTEQKKKGGKRYLSKFGKVKQTRRR